MVEWIVDKPNKWLAHMAERYPDDAEGFGPVANYIDHLRHQLGKARNSLDGIIGSARSGIERSAPKENKCRAYLDKDGVMICDECMISAMPGSPIPICEKTGRKIDVSATDAGLSENSRQNGGRSGDGDRTNGQDEMDPEFQARVLTGETCHSARDGDCDHPDCPQNSDGEPEKSGRHCPLDWNCARCGQNWGECECGPHDIPTPPSF